MQTGCVCGLLLAERRFWMNEAATASHTDQFWRRFWRRCLAECEDGVGLAAGNAVHVGADGLGRDRCDAPALPMLCSKDAQGFAHPDGIRLPGMVVLRATVVHDLDCDEPQL